MCVQMWLNRLPPQGIFFRAHDIINLSGSRFFIKHNNSIKSRYIHFIEYVVPFGPPLEGANVHEFLAIFATSISCGAANYVTRPPFLKIPMITELHLLIEEVKIKM